MDCRSKIPRSKNSRTCAVKVRGVGSCRAHTCPSSMRSRSCLSWSVATGAGTGGAATGTAGAAGVGGLLVVRGTFIGISGSPDAVRLSESVSSDDNDGEEINKDSALRVLVLLAEGDDSALARTWPTSSGKDSCVDLEANSSEAEVNAFVSRSQLSPLSTCRRLDPFTMMAQQQQWPSSLGITVTPARIVSLSVARRLLRQEVPSGRKTYRPEGGTRNNLLAFVSLMLSGSSFSSGREYGSGSKIKAAHLPHDHQGEWQLMFSETIFHVFREGSVQNVVHN
jgi:hypothetical protein